MSENIKEKTPSASKVSNTDSIPNKLLEFQKRVSAISKDSVNPFFHSKYFDVNTVIDTIKPILNEVGLIVSQPLEVIDGKNILATDVWDEHGTYLESQILIPEIADVQKLGAAITYLRRYALVSLLLLQGEDDDDGNLSKPSKAPVKQNPAPTATKTDEVVSDEYECPVHGKTVSLRPAGITKQGKKYGSFYACNERVDGKFCKERAIKVSQEELPIIQIDDPVPYIPNHEGD